MLIEGIQGARPYKLLLYKGILLIVLEHEVRNFLRPLAFVRAVMSLSQSLLAMSSRVGLSKGIVCYSSVNSLDSGMAIIR